MLLFHLKRVTNYTAWKLKLIINVQISPHIPHKKMLEESPFKQWLEGGICSISTRIGIQARGFSLDVTIVQGS